MDAALRKSEDVSVLELLSSNFTAYLVTSTISVKKKLNHYKVFVLSKILYGLDGILLSTTECRRLDAFLIRCFRRILKIPHPYYSRISNAEVLNNADFLPLSSMVKLIQLKYVIKIAKLPFVHVFVHWYSVVIIRLINLMMAYLANKDAHD